MILIAGSGQLAVAIEHRVRASGHPVERLRPCNDDTDGLDPALCRRNDVLVLAADDDTGNVDLALKARRMKPGLRPVVRLFDAALATYLEEAIPDVRILSMSRITAPVLAAAARRLLVEPSAPTRIRRHPLARSARPFQADRILLGALLSLFLLFFRRPCFSRRRSISPTSTHCILCGQR